MAVAMTRAAQQPSKMTHNCSQQICVKLLDHTRIDSRILNYKTSVRVHCCHRLVTDISKIRSARLCQVQGRAHDGSKKTAALLSVATQDLCKMRGLPLVA
jgi:hypothetical protein